jgi:hypothetical protein
VDAVSPSRGSVHALNCALGRAAPRDSPPTPEPWAEVPQTPSAPLGTVSQLSFVHMVTDGLLDALKLTGEDWQRVAELIETTLIFAMRAK